MNARKLIVFVSILIILGSGGVVAHALGATDYVRARWFPDKVAALHKTVATQVQIERRNLPKPVTPEITLVDATGNGSELTFLHTVGATAATGMERRLGVMKMETAKQVCTGELARLLASGASLRYAYVSQDRSHEIGGFTITGCTR